MNIEYRNIVGTKILREEDGGLVGLVKDIIINPDNGKVEAFWAKPITPIEDAIVVADDVISIKKNFYVKDESVFAPAEDVLKIADILSRNTLYIGNIVKNESNEVLGKVTNLSFDSKTFYLKSIESQKMFLVFGHSGRIFPYDSIIEVLPDGIIVKDTVEKKEASVIQDQSPALDT